MQACLGPHTQGVRPGQGRLLVCLENKLNLSQAIQCNHKLDYKGIEGTHFNRRDVQCGPQYFNIVVR